MNTPLGFIGAIFEPCESKGQALLTAACMLIVAAGAIAIGYAMFQFGEGARLTLLEAHQDGTDYGRRNESGLYQYMIIGYCVATITGLFALLMIVSAIIAPVRTLFPKELRKREEVLR